MRVLGISTSPRKNGNSDLLLRRALEGAASNGANVEYVHLADLTIGPCTECNACYTTGKCAVQDDYQKLMSEILEADRLIFATPIFFSGVCAQAKMLIDRAQCLWARKYVLKQPPPADRQTQHAMVIVVGGSKSKKQFGSVKLTMKYYFDALGFDYAFNLFVSRVDALEDIKSHTSAMDEVFRLGSELASDTLSPAKEPIDVELF